MCRSHTSLKSELDALHMAGENGEWLMRHFVEKLCTGYSGLMHSHAASYRNRLNAVFVDAQLRAENVGGYFICVGEDRYSLGADEATSD